MTSVNASYLAKACQAGIWIERAAHLQPDMSADALWQHVWQKIRFAGFKADFVGGEIQRLRPFFAGFQALSRPEWHFDPNRNAHGEAVRDFLTKSGRFDGITYHKNAQKLRKILLKRQLGWRLAGFCEFPARDREAWRDDPITVLSSNGRFEDYWESRRAA